MIYGNPMNYNSYSPYNQQQYYQQPVQQQQQPVIFGRVVNSFDELTVNDIPMNGSAAYFPKADMSEIECRKWMSDGTIHRSTFKPVLDTNLNNLACNDKNSLELAVNALQDNINDRLDRLEKMIKPSRSKKEGEEA